ncbi:MAG: FHA domain-containing protein, partial [Aquihabitans sp.]
THRPGRGGAWHEIPLREAVQVRIDLAEATEGPSVTLPVGLAPASSMVVARSASAALAEVSVPRSSSASDRAEGSTSAPAPAPEPSAGTAPADDPAPAASADGGADLDFRHLFEETTFRPPEPASAPEPAPPVVDATDPTTQIFDTTSAVPVVDDRPPPPSPLPTASPTPSATQPAPPDPPAPSGGGLIDWVPGMSAPAGAPAPAPSTSGTSALPPPPTNAPAPAPATEAGVGGDDTALEDATITLAALRAARSASSTPAAGPMVAAVVCPSGHANPTHSDRCRSCGSGIVDRTPRTIPRPSLGRLRFADGRTAELDRHLLIGRSPATDVLVNNEPTGTVKLPDPESVLSRTHVAIQLDGWQVQVIDRDSMNHTYVEIPGRPPFQIRPGEPYPLPPGSTVRLGDDVGFVFEADAG